MEGILQVLCAGLGTWGFALLFHVQRKHILTASLGGALSWLCYLISEGLGADVFLSTLLASLVICLWSEGMARIKKAPANVFLIPGIIPLLPGGHLYYAMQGIVFSDQQIFLEHGMTVALIAVGIAGGILAASEIVRILVGIQRHRKKTETI